jgi:hypothetical protein
VTVVVVESLLLVASGSVVVLLMATLLVIWPGAPNASLTTTVYSTRPLAPAASCGAVQTSSRPCTLGPFSAGTSVACPLHVALTGRVSVIATPRASDGP